MVLMRVESAGWESDSSSSYATVGKVVRELQAHSSEERLANVTRREGRKCSRGCGKERKGRTSLHEEEKNEKARTHTFLCVTCVSVSHFLCLGEVRRNIDSRASFLTR